MWEKSGTPETERTVLHRIARRSGFSERDLQDRDARYISLLIACRDLGRFPKDLRGKSVEDLQQVVELYAPTTLRVDG
jgi:hypothetical protein